MTPAENASDDANTSRLAILTSDGINTTAAPIAVANPAPITNPNANATFSSASLDVDMIYRLFLSQPTV